MANPDFRRGDAWHIRLRFSLLGEAWHAVSNHQKALNYRAQIHHLAPFILNRPLHSVRSELTQELLRFDHDRRIGAFSEPIVDRTEQGAGFSVLALVAPEAGEAGRCPQLKRLRTLPPGNGKCLTIALFGTGLIALDIQ